MRPERPIKTLFAVVQLGEMVTWAYLIGDVEGVDEFKRYLVSKSGRT